MSKIETIAALDALYGPPKETALVKEIPVLSPDYCTMIEASSFAALATSGPEGLDCSPRGDLRGRFVRVADERTILLPDRRGNNRVDSLRNIVRDPRVALLFLIPGLYSALRVNGLASIVTDPDLCASFAVNGELPRSVIVVSVGSAYFQCSRAIDRAGLWRPETHVDPASVPTPGAILETLSGGTIDGRAFDARGQRQS